MPNPDKIKNLGTILAVWAHPDDETFAAGGLLAQAVANGQRVVCITATCGEKGIQDPSRWSPARLGDIRTAELATAMKIIGITERELWDYPDGDCRAIDESEAVERIALALDKYQPDTIVTFGPDGITGHPDHQAVSRWVSQATIGKQIPIYQVVLLRSCYQAMHQAEKQFNVFLGTPPSAVAEDTDCDLVLNLSDELLTKKYDALAAMPSQYERMFQALGREQVCKMLCSEGFKLAAP